MKLSLVILIVQFGVWDPITLPESNIAHENHIFPGKYHQNGGFSMAMLVSGRVSSLGQTEISNGWS